MTTQNVMPRSISTILNNPAKKSIFDIGKFKSESPNKIAREAHQVVQEEPNDSISEILMNKNDDTDREMGNQVVNRSIHSTNVPGLNNAKHIKEAHQRQPYNKVIDLSNFGDDMANEEEKQVA